MQRPPKSIRIARQADGKFKAEGLGAWYHYWRDPYHLLLTIPWWGFVSIVGIAYLLLNMMFAGLYLLGGNVLTGARPGSFEDAFFFSVQTLGSIGYGVISPQTTYANVIVTLEALASLLVIAVVTGLSFARFSKPTARVIFSDYVVIVPHNGVPTLMFRMANQRGNQILEAQLRLYLLRSERTAEGESFYRVHSLDLLRDRNPGFSLSWTAMHPIGPSSPLYGATPETLVQDHAQLVISMSGIDETVSYTVTLRHVYGASQILFDYRFVDIIETTPDGDRYFNRAKFHDVEPLQSAAYLSQSLEFRP
ncbi:MAG: ion channel [Thermosynechococcaceae cyanobacterium]